MWPGRLLGLTLVLGISVGIILLVRLIQAETPTPLPTILLYRDATVPIEVRIEDLLSLMTRAEKIGQMALVEKNSLKNLSDIKTYQLGALLSGAGAKPDVNTADGWAQMIAEYQAIARTTRLGIPLLYGADAIHGQALVPGATIFPHAVGLGATNNPELVGKVAAATALEMRQSGVNWNFAPNLDLPQDIRWGRGYEAFSDNPARVASLTAATVRGLQNPQGTTLPVLATLKHYVGLGAMGWHTSTNKNFKIDQGMTVADIPTLESVYLPPFQAGIEAGALSVMIGLNEWGNTRLAHEKYLITDVLKNQLGFTGFTVSDWYGVYEIPGNKFFNTVHAINAGVDMFMLPFDYKTFIRHVKWANTVGLISNERLDDAVRRILRAKFTIGLFDEPVLSDLPPPVSLTTPLHQARQAVAESLVLLKNEADILPLSSHLPLIRVAGSVADNVGRGSGAWTVEWQGVDGNWLPGSSSILAGIKAQVSAVTKVEYSETGEFTSVRGKAPIGIAVVGEAPYAEGWGDREFPILSDTDRQAINNLRAVCDQVIVILVSGRPLLIAHEINDWATVIAAWLPGGLGFGVVDGLFGLTPFTGTLPVAWPRTTEQLPLSPTGETADGTSVLFPSGFSLSL
jgi:beta-glucosidase